MSGSSRSTRPPENWHPDQDDWLYVPDNFNRNRSLNYRRRTLDPWSLFEERYIGGPDNYGLGASFPPPPPAPRSQLQLLLVNDYHTYPGARYLMPNAPPTYNHEPRYNQIAAEEGSRLNQEVQKQALNKLRKQLYSPHLSSIVRRLGTSKSTSSAGSVKSQDEDGKRCAVCLEDFDTRQFVMLTPCNHMFHEECIVPWMKSQGKCPVCRFVIAG
ncbi:hypothetical protein ACJIZ3_007299 [Penstemon smallii]|uniref:RING-type E3 ubiquitin transferase n=1 Tax=Penstemon smallii TaxID=265156 RepID=A0ABD3SA45_9LAMI